MSNKEKQRKLLQENLRSIRKIAGWTAECLGDKVGLSKQTISNMENGKTQMTLTQYIAIRAVLDFEIALHPENTVLPQVIDILVDKGSELEDENYTEVKETVNTVAASASTVKNGEQLEKMLKLLVSPGVIGALVALGVILGDTSTVKKLNWLK